MTTPFVHYPRWAQTLAHGIRARLGNTFVLHGNTLDLLPVPKGAGEPRTMADFLPLSRFLGEWIFGQRQVVIEYQRANGAILGPHSSNSIAGLFSAASVIARLRMSSSAGVRSTSSIERSSRIPHA